FFFIIYGPLYGLVCAFGLIGNSLSFAVLHKYTGGNVGTYLLKALALMDNLFLATAAGIQMYLAMAMYFNLRTQLEPIYPAFQTYAWPLAHIVQMCTVWMMVLVAGNRYFAVCRPLDAPRLCTRHNVQLEIMIMASAVCVFNIPRFFEYRYVTHNVTTIDENNITSWDERSENVGLTSLHLYNILYENVSYCLFVFLLPLLILIFFNVNLMHDLKVAQRSRKAMTSRSSNDENNITLVMIIIIIVFIVCQTPATINQILYYIIDDAHTTTCTPYKQYYHVSNLLITMNSSLNFVIYCLFRRQFQHQLCQLFGR
ncbi:FMRFamide receptor, partial [Lamellibrachia satsuma]